MKIDRSTFPPFYERFSAPAHRRAMVLLRRDADAWDVVQQVFRRALETPLDFPNDLAALGWVYRTSTNLSLKVLRSRKLREVGVEATLSAEPSFEPRHLEARQFAKVLASGLSERELEIAVLHLLDGMTQDEIAEVLKVSRKTVVRDLQRIRAIAQSLAGEHE